MVHSPSIRADGYNASAFVPSHINVDKLPPSAKPARSDTTSAKQATVRVPDAGPRPNVNPNLDSFEAVMKAMDVELAHSKASRPKKSAPSTGKGKGKAESVVLDDEEDIEAVMDAELKAALHGNEDDEDGEEDPMDYNLIKNFLESYKSQAGLSGPVGNLAGRLQPGWKLPRDES